jgi:hypothetical protein
MTYDHTKFTKLRSLRVPRPVALALADDSNPLSTQGTITKMDLIAQLNTGTATTAQIATAVNTLLTELIAAGLMKSS